MLNVTKVNSQIRKSDVLFWTRTEDVDMVANGYWLIKADLKQEKYRKILGLLVEKFGFIPENNQTYRLDNYCWYDKKPLNKVENIFNDFLKIPKTLIEDTRLIEIEGAGKKNKRIFKGEHYTYIDSRFMSMIKENEDIKYYNESNLMPLYACLDDEFVMILPIRMEGNNEHLKEIKKEPIADQAK
jgi:hypothetical protein